MSRQCESILRQSLPRALVLPAIAVDVRLELFSRAWVIAEMVQARKSGMVQKLKLHSKQALKEHIKVVATLDISNCEAAREEDKARILSGVENIPEFNDALRHLLLDSKTGLFAEWMADEDTSTTLCGQVCELIASLTFRAAQ